MPRRRALPRPHQSCVCRVPGWSRLAQAHLRPATKKEAETISWFLTKILGFQARVELVLLHGDFRELRCVLIHRDFARQFKAVNLLELFENLFGCSRGSSHLRRLVNLFG